MSNKNHPGNDYQLPDDSFLYNLDVNDWSMLAHPEETDQPDDDRGVGGEPGRFDQEQRSEPEAKVAIEPTRAKDEGEVVGATKTPEVKAIPGLAREQVIAEVALAGQVGQTARKGEANSPYPVESEETGEEAMESQEQEISLNMAIMFMVMRTLMEAQDEGADFSKSPAERLINDPDWQKLGDQAGNKIRSEMMEMYISVARHKHLRSDNGSKRDTKKQERALATKYADAAYTLVKQLYANPGWSPDELLQRELLQRDIEESPDEARLAEALDDVHDLFTTDHGGRNSVKLCDILQIARRDLPPDDLSDLEQYFVEHEEYRDNGCAGVIALYYLRKKPNGDKSIEEILRSADDNNDVDECEQELELVDEMVDRIDQYFDEVGAEKSRRHFTTQRLNSGGRGNMLYRWVSARNSEYKAPRLDERKLWRLTEEYTSSNNVHSYIVWKWGEGLYEMANTTKRYESKMRQRAGNKRWSRRTK